MWCKWGWGFMNHTFLDNWYFYVHHHASEIYKFLTYCVPLSQPTPNCPTEHPPTQAETLDMPRGRNEQWPEWDEKRVRRTDRGEWTKRTTKVRWIHVKKESLINRWKKEVNDWNSLLSIWPRAWPAPHSPAQRTKGCCSIDIIDRADLQCAPYKSTRSILVQSRKMLEPGRPSNLT